MPNYSLWSTRSFNEQLREILAFAIQISEGTPDEQVAARDVFHRSVDALEHVIIPGVRGNKPYGWRYTKEDTRMMVASTLRYALSMFQSEGDV